MRRNRTRDDGEDQDKPRDEEEEQDKRRDDDGEQGGRRGDDDGGTGRAGGAKPRGEGGNEEQEEGGPTLDLPPPVVFTLYST